MQKVKKPIHDSSHVHQLSGVYSDITWKAAMEYGTRYRDSFISYSSQWENKKRQISQLHTWQILVCKKHPEIAIEVYREVELSDGRQIKTDKATWFI